MMKFHKPGRLRLAGGAAAIVMLGGVSLAFGSAGQAAQPAPPAPPAPPSAPRTDGHDHDHDNTRVIVRTIDRRDHRDGVRSERREGRDGERREERRVMVFTDRHDGDRDGEHRRIIERHGPGDHHVMMMGLHDCQDANRSEINEGNDSNRTRIIVCSRGRDGEQNAAQQAEALQRARARLAEDDDIPAGQRQRVLGAIDREIARLRGQ